MKTFRNIFGLLGILGFIEGVYYKRPDVIFMALVMICGAVAIDINIDKTKKDGKK